MLLPICPLFYASLPRIPQPRLAALPLRRGLATCGHAHSFGHCFRARLGRRPQPSTTALELLRPHLRVRGPLRPEHDISTTTYLCPIPKTLTT